MCDRAIGRKIREMRETEQPAIIDNSKNNPAIIDNLKNVAAPKYFDARPRDWLHQKKDFPFCCSTTRPSCPIMCGWSAEIENAKCI